MEEPFNEPPVKKYHVKARVITLIFFIVFSLVGLIISDVARAGSWNYWRVMVPVFALAGLSFTFYLRKIQKEAVVKTIWHELAQWVGLIGVIFILSIYVSVGIIGRFEAGLFVLTMVSFNLFILGIYIEMTFLFIGLILALISLGAGVFAEYLYTIIIPLSILLIVLFFFYLKNASKRER